MNALDAQRIEKSCSVAYDKHPGSLHFRNGIVAAFRNDLRAIGNRLAALEMTLHRICALELTEQIERIDLRALVVKRVGIADHDLRFRYMIHKSAAVGIEVAWPSERVHHLAGLLSTCGNLDQLLDADGVRLRTHTLESLRGDQPFSEDAAAALGKNHSL